LLIYTVERTVTMPALMDSFQSLTAKIYQSWTLSTMETDIRISISIQGQTSQKDRTD
jgi:hypothetical protein